MAKIDPVRRAEIGREKRARTRAVLLAAANSLFANRAVESITVDDVVQEAGVAKGTFYVHFEDLHALTAAVADELIGTFDEFLQPQRLSIPDPLTRIVFGCNSFLERGLGDPAWAAVVARMAWSHPSVGQTARNRLMEDLREVVRANPHSHPSFELSLEIVLGVMLQVLAAIGHERFSPLDRLAAIGAILRAIGIAGQQAKSALACLPQSASTKRKAGRGRRSIGAS